MYRMLLGWILSLLGFENRGIFRFWDGSRARGVDPLEILRGLYEIKGFDVESTPKLLEAPDQRTRLEATRDIAAAVRSVFLVPRLDNRGLTETECVELLADFLDYCEDLKKNIKETPTSQPSTASEPSPAPTVESLIAAGWGSRSTPTDSSDGSQNLPDTGSLEHSADPSKRPAEPLPNPTSTAT